MQQSLLKPRGIPFQCQLRHTHANNARNSTTSYTISVECITYSVDEALLSKVVHSHGDVNHILDKLLHWTFVFLESGDQYKRYYDHKQFAVSSITCILTNAPSRTSDQNHNIKSFGPTGTPNPTSKKTQHLRDMGANIPSYNYTLLK